jgi:L,D-transpeptidase catalytic domain
MKYKLYFFFTILILSFTITFCIKNKQRQYQKTKSNYSSIIDSLYGILIKKPGVNKEILFMLDMKITSNKNRFFIVDLHQKKIINSSLVAQGINTKLDKNGTLVFSNEINSYCTSLGIYTIGNKYLGQFGYAYKLYGLDKSNSNAFKRNIVLHSYYKIPNAEQKEIICNSLGCPMVSKEFFKKLEKLIDQSKQPITLTIFY